MYGGRGFNCPSHFLYADDILSFSKASRSNIDVLANVFSEYRRLSGQVVNWDKSNFF